MFSSGYSSWSWVSTIFFAPYCFMLAFDLSSSPGVLSGRIVSDPHSIRSLVHTFGQAYSSVLLVVGR